MISESMAMSILAHASSMPNVTTESTTHKCILTLSLSVDSVQNMQSVACSWYVSGTVSASTTRPCRRLHRLFSLLLDSNGNASHHHRPVTPVDGDRRWRYCLVWGPLYI